MGKSAAVKDQRAALLQDCRDPRTRHEECEHLVVTFLARMDNDLPTTADLCVEPFGEEEQSLVKREATSYLVGGTDLGLS